MKAASGQVTVTGEGSFNITQRLGMATVLGVTHKPTQVQVDGTVTTNWDYLFPQTKLVIQNMTTDLNQPVTLAWN
jgi:alpha-glucosidase